MRRLTLLTCAALLGLGAAGAEQARYSADTLKQALPNTYVTLPFEFDGAGEYQFEVAGPEGWSALSASKKLSVQGHALVPFTFKVPNLALLGIAPFTLIVRQDGREVARAQAQVNVERRVLVGVRAPDTVNVPIGQIGRYPVTVTNLGNATDTIRLFFDVTPNGTLLAQDTFTLAPGQSAQTTVVLDRRSKRDNGASFLFTVNAASVTDPRVTAAADTQVMWGVSAASTPDARPDPKLTVNVSAGLVGSVGFGSQGFSRDLSYSLGSTVSGDLSDYYTATATPSSLSGSLDHPLPGVPSLTFGVKTADWGANLNVGLGALGGSGTFNWRGWEWSPQVGVAWGGGVLGYGAGLGARGLIGSGTFAARLGTYGVTGPNASRSDSLVTSYRVQLTPGWTLDVQPAVYGVTTPKGYSVLFGLGQSSTYQGENFDVTESFGSDLRAYHSFSVAGGLRNVSPFGVRASASAQLAPQGLSWNAAGVLLLSPGHGLGASLLGSFTSTPDGAAWTVSPSAAYTFSAGAWTGSMGGVYALSGDHFGLNHALQLNLDLNAGRIQTNTTATYQSAHGPDPRKIGLELSANYLLTDSDILTGKYGLTLASATTQAVTASWTHVWTNQLQSSVAYTRNWGAGAVNEGAAVGLAWSGIGVDGLTLAANYSVSAPNTLFAGNLQHKVTLGLQYDTALTFNTPKGVVNLFGGRRGGSVFGQLYRDGNMNGVLDAGETPLAGVTVQAGDEKTVTDASGHYRLRVPAGQYTLRFPTGLPTTLASLTPLQATVVENGEQRLDAAMVPVNSLEVTVFDDANNNKVLDNGEQPIPFAGATLSGPVTRAGTADADGVVRFSELPTGEYSVGVDPKRLPDGYQQTTTSAKVTVTEQRKPDGVVLGAAQPPRQQAVTFTASNLAVMATASSDTAKPGDQVTVQVFLSGDASTVKVQAFNQVFQVQGSGSQRSVDLTVPAGTAPGEYPLVVTAENAGGAKQASLSVTVPAAP